MNVREVMSSGGYKGNFNHLVPKVEDVDFAERFEFLKEFAAYWSQKNSYQPKAKNTEKYISEGKSIHGNKFDYKYAVFINSTTLMILWCNDCKKFIYQTATNHTKHGCKACSMRELSISKSLPEPEFKLRAQALHRHCNYDDIKFISCNRKVENILCTLCGKYFDSLGEAHINPNRPIGCPHCRRSKAEILAENFLTDNGYIFTPQFKDPSLKLTNVLKIDFMLHFGDLKLAVELNGKQHYIQANRSKDMELNRRNFELYQIRDAIKVKWCAERGIPLLVISYLEFHKIPELIEAFILENTKKQIELDI